MSARDLDANVLLTKTSLVAELTEARAALARVEALVKAAEAREAASLSRTFDGGSFGAWVDATSLHAALRTPDTEGGDRHPEDYCHRCDGPNISWSTPSEVWDPVMRPGGHNTTEWLWNEIICPVCFAELFEQRFPKTSWRLTPDEATIGGRAFRAAAEGGA